MVSDDSLLHTKNKVINKIHSTAIVSRISLGILVTKNPHLTHISMEFTNIGQLSVIYMANHLKNPMYINMDYTSYAEFINVSSLKQKCKVVTYKRI